MTTNGTITLAQYIYSSAQTFVAYYLDAVEEMIAEIAPEPDYSCYEYDDEGYFVTYRFDDARPADEETREALDTLADDLADLRAIAYGYWPGCYWQVAGEFAAAHLIVNELRGAAPFEVLTDEGLENARATVDRVLDYDRLTPDLAKTRDWLTWVAAERAAGLAATN